MAAVTKRYKDPKHDAKEYFLDVSRDYDDVEGARKRPPEGMKPENWLRAVDQFCSEEHMRKSTINKAGRHKQTSRYRGGTSYFANHCHKKSIEQYEAYRSGHTRRQGTFDTPQNEENYYMLKSRFESEHQRIAEEEKEEEGGGGSSSQRLDKVSIFEEVLGRRRGHVRGIGPMPCPRESLPHLTPTQPQPQLTKEQINAILANPQFQAQIFQMCSQFFQSQNFENQGGSDNSGDHDEDEDV